MADFNYLFSIYIQSGSTFQNEMSKHLPNATKCLGWHNVKQSHITNDQRVVVKLEDIYGMTILLMGGLSGSVILILIEALLEKLKTIYPGKCHFPNHKKTMLILHFFRISFENQNRSCKAKDTFYTRTMCELSGKQNSQ